MKILIVLVGALALAGYSNGLTIELPEWESFKFYFNKSYPDVESESFRRNIFEENRKYIQTFNANNNKSYTLRINHFADMSKEEMRARNGLLTSNSMPRNTLQGEQYLQSIYDRDTQIPNEVDWRKVPGRVSKAKNQLHCASCWTFAATGVLEGQEKVHRDFMKKKKGTLVSLSEQNLVDCVTDSFGCKGGRMADAFDYIKQNGIEDEQSYPYEAKAENCRFDNSKSVMTDKGHAILPEGDEEKLKEVVAKYGPVAVAIDDISSEFAFYRDGVYKDDLCKNTLKHMSHAILVVGYGTDPKEGDYWIIKNSWGEQWGQNGFGLFARNRNNQCGIAEMATIATF